MILGAEQNEHLENAAEAEMAESTINLTFRGVIICSRQEISLRVDRAILTGFLCKVFPCVVYELGDVWVV